MGSANATPSHQHPFIPRLTSCKLQRQVPPSKSWSGFHKQSCTVNCYQNRTRTLGVQFQLEEVLEVDIEPHRGYITRLMGELFHYFPIFLGGARPRFRQLGNWSAAPDAGTDQPSNLGPCIRLSHGVSRRHPWICCFLLVLFVFFN